MLRELAGRESPTTIARLLEEHFSLRRTVNAVQVRFERLGLSEAPLWHSCRSLGALFGVDGKTITHSWVKRGWLDGERIQQNVPGSGWMFRDEQIERFIRDFPQVYDYRRMQSGRWRALAEIVWKSDPLLPLEQAARAIGVNASTLRTHCVKGWIPSCRRLLKSGARNGILLLRRSDLKAFAYRRPELIGKSGRPRKAA